MRHADQARRHALAGVERPRNDETVRRGGRTRCGGIWAGSFEPGGEGAQAMQFVILYHSALARRVSDNLSNGLLWRERRIGSVSSIQVQATPRLGGDLRVRPSVPEDAEAIVDLMRHARLDPHVQPEHLHWKYWRERSDVPGPRSIVLTDGRALLAHAALIPGTLRWGATEARVIHMIDWAARREAAGAGVRLMMHVGRQTDFLLAIGGSKDTLTIMPRMGYKLCGTVTGHVRTIAPLGILKRPSPSAWKVLPRIARSFYWTLTAPGGDWGRWEVRRIGYDEVDRLSPVLPSPRPGMAIFGRTTERLRHALSCPIVPMELYALEKAGEIGGYFLLSYAPGQARLADCWMRSEDPADWRAMIHAAVDRARRRGGSAEITVWSSDPKLGQVLGESGFHARQNLPIYLKASGREPLPGDTLRVQMLEDDAFYFYTGGNALWA